MIFFPYANRSMSGHRAGGKNSTPCISPHHISVIDPTAFVTETLQWIFAYVSPDLMPKDMADSMAKFTLEATSANFEDLRATVHKCGKH